MSYRNAYTGLTGFPRTSTQAERTLANSVSFDVYCRPTELAPGEEWPPNRFTDRDARLATLEGLWRGDFGTMVDLGPNAVVVNEFHTYSTKLANILLVSEPVAEGLRVVPGLIEQVSGEMAPGLGDTNGLIEVCYDAIIDLTRYGGAILLRQGDLLTVVPATAWYPTRDSGTLFTSIWLSDDATDSVPNRLDVLHVADGRATRITYEYRERQLGRRLNSEDLGPAEVEVVRREPNVGIWGTAKYLELYPLVVEQCRRFSKNSRVLDLFTSPAPVFRQADLDARAMFNVAADDTDDEAQRKILEGQVGLLDEDTIHLPDDLLDIDYLQPSTEGVGHALGQVESIDQRLRSVAGLPDLSGQTFSGEALKREFIHFYAESRAIQMALRAALERLLGVTVTWEHIFDTDAFSEAPTPGRGGPNAMSDPLGDEDEMEEPVE